MEPVYIVMICAGGVFLILLLAYFLVYTKQKKIKLRESQKLLEAYSNGKITKMDYDLAFYDEETRKLLGGATEGQVTIEDILSSDSASVEEVTKKTDEAIFNKIENEGVEEITGNYKG
ncbi:MAG: hypothetical protein ACI4L9_05615 [Candidatus Coproplasma sp.]